MRARQFFQIVIILSILIAVGIAIVSVASAHILSLPGAKRVASREVARIADTISQDERISWTVTRCHRQAPVSDRHKHIIRCRATYFSIKREKACYNTVEVKFRSNTSRVISTREFGVPKCYKLDL